MAKMVFNSFVTTLKFNCAWIALDSSMLNCLHFPMQHFSKENVALQL